MIQFEKISFGYTPKKLIFENFSWQVQTGESWAVLGSSGCGKTTLFYLLAGLRIPNSGEILISGKKLVKPRPQTGLILQDYGLLPWATVRENVTLGLRIRQFYGPDGKHAPDDAVITEIEEEGMRWMERLGLLDIANRYPEQISGGQRQRTAIARTLAINPDLLLMDEPFASLDVPTRESLQGFVLEMRQEKQITNILVTHSIEEAALMGEKVMVLKTDLQCTPQIFENPSYEQRTQVDNPDFIDFCRVLRQEIAR